VLFLGDGRLVAELEQPTAESVLEVLGRLAPAGHHDAGRRAAQNHTPGHHAAPVAQVLA
jgi:hypothetical protein